LTAPCLLAETHCHGLATPETKKLASEMSFWRPLADPIMMHDPFLTLVRLLYVFKGELPDVEGLKTLIRFLHLVLREQVRGTALYPIKVKRTRITPLCEVVFLCCSLLLLSSHLVVASGMRFIWYYLFAALRQAAILVWV
jgi:hypothetical protein